MALDAEDQMAARGEALEAFRPLYLAEQQRMTNLNARALGVISASSIVTAIAGFFAKDALSGASGSLDQLGAARDWAIWLLIIGVGLLGISVLTGVWTLWPRDRATIKLADLPPWADGGEATSTKGEVMRQVLGTYAKAIKDLREFNAEKTWRLRATYFSFATAVSLIAVDAILFFQAAL
jgi:hypothetical protein